MFWIWKGRKRNQVTVSKKFQADIYDQWEYQFSTQIPKTNCQVSVVGFVGFLTFFEISFCHFSFCSLPRTPFTSLVAFSLTFFLDVGSLTVARSPQSYSSR